MEIRTGRAGKSEGAGQFRGCFDGLPGVASAHHFQTRATTGREFGNQSASGSGGQPIAQRMGQHRMTAGAPHPTHHLLHGRPLAAQMTGFALTEVAVERRCHVRDQTRFDHGGCPMSKGRPPRPGVGGVFPVRGEF